jgi:hypothetical protein
MPDLRDLLHGGAHLPRERFEDDPDRQEAAERRHRRRVVAALIVTLGLIAGTWIGLRIVATSDEDVRVVSRPAAGPTIRPPDERGVSQWIVPGATAVTLAGDDLWVAGRVPDRRAGWYLARLDRSTGKERARIAVAHVVQRVAVGLGMVWGFGGGDPAEPNGGVTVVDPDRKQVVATYGYDHPFSPSGLVFVDKAAVVSDTTRDRVLLFDLRAGTLSVAASYQVGDQPTDLVAPYGGSPWVRESGAGTISRVPITEPPRTRQWVGRLLAPAGSGRLWATEGDDGPLVHLTPELLDQENSVALGARMGGVRATAVADDPEGIWTGGPDGVARFVRRSLESAGNPSAAAALGGYRISSLAGNTQGVWFVAQEPGTVYRWIPKDLAAPEPSVDSQPRRRAGPDTFVAVEASRLALFDAHTGRRRSFLTDGQTGGGDASPAMTDDGTVFFVRGSGACSSAIWRLPPGGPESQVVPPAGGTIPHMAASPDGRMLAWVEQPCGDVAVLKTRNLATGGERSFTMDAPPSVEGRPAWSPDNRHLAYFYGRSGAGVGGVRILDTASAVRRADESLALRDRDCPQWSPAFLSDGTLVALACRNPANLDRIDAVRFDPATGRALGTLFSLPGPAGKTPELFLVTSFDFSTRGRDAIYQIRGQAAGERNRTFQWDGNSVSSIATDAKEPTW